MRTGQILLAGAALAMAAASMPSLEAQARRNGPIEQRTERVQMPRPMRASTIGVRLSDVTDQQMKTYKLSRAEGAIVEAVTPNTPAATAGLRENDVILEFDGERVRSTRHLTRLVAETPVGRDVPLVVMRDGHRTSLRVTTAAGDASTWFDPSVVFDGDQVREYAEEAERAAGEIRRKLPDMMEGMRAGMLNRGRLGVSVLDITPELAEYFGVKSGVLISSVTPDSPAAKAGLKAGDVITAIDGKAVGSPRELVQALPNGEGSHEVDLTYVRDKQQRSARATFDSSSRQRMPARRGQPL